MIGEQSPVVGDCARIAIHIEEAGDKYVARRVSYFTRSLDHSARSDRPRFGTERRRRVDECIDVCVHLRSERRHQLRIFRGELRQPLGEVNRPAEGRILEDICRRRCTAFSDRAGDGDGRIDCLARSRDLSTGEARVSLPAAVDVHLRIIGFRHRENAIGERFGVGSREESRSGRRFEQGARLHDVLPVFTMFTCLNRAGTAPWLTELDCPGSPFPSPNDPPSQ